MTQSHFLGQNDPGLSWWFKADKSQSILWFLPQDYGGEDCLGRVASWQKGSLLLLMAILATICPRGWQSTAASYGHLSPGFSHTPNSWILIAQSTCLFLQSSFSSYAKIFILGPLPDFFLTPDFLTSQIVGEGLCYRIFKIIFYLITTRMINFSLQSDINLTVLNLNTKSRCDSPMDRHFEGTAPAQSWDRFKLSVQDINSEDAQIWTLGWQPLFNHFLIGK